jgi:hypothetical protein
MPCVLWTGPREELSNQRGCSITTMERRITGFDRRPAGQACVVTNVYLVTRRDGSVERLFADSHRREGDVLVFTLVSGEEVARMPVKDILIVKDSPDEESGPSAPGEDDG